MESAQVHKRVVGDDIGAAGAVGEGIEDEGHVESVEVVGARDFTGDEGLADVKIKRVHRHIFLQTQGIFSPTPH